MIIYTPTKKRVCDNIEKRTMCETNVSVGFWNILAEGLSAGEFMSPTIGEEAAL
jgi:hypothetical protein